MRKGGEWWMGRPSGLATHCRIRLDMYSIRGQKQFDDQGESVRCVPVHLPSTPVVGTCQRSRADARHGCYKFVTCSPLIGVFRGPSTPGPAVISQSPGAASCPTPQVCRVGDAVASDSDSGRVQKWVVRRMVAVGVARHIDHQLAALP